MDLISVVSLEDCLHLPQCEIEPVDCVGAWSDYGECPVTCSTGMVSRTFEITEEGNGFGTKCLFGHGVTESVICDMGPCPIDCKYDWSEWSVTGEVCGIGTQSRKLNIISEPLRGGEACPSNRTQTRSEILEPCPTVCEASWSEYSVKNYRKCIFIKSIRDELNVVSM